MNVIAKIIVFILMCWLFLLGVLILTWLHPGHGVVIPIMPLLLTPRWQNVIFLW